MSSERIDIHPISGFPEWLPNMRLAELRLIDAISRQYERYGFTPIQTPIVEQWDILTAKSGAQRQIFTVGRPQEGEQDEDQLGLRFDLTVPLARYVVQHANELTFPFRRYAIDKVWRGERPKRGRYREFYQCDIDVIGMGQLDLAFDAEVACTINSTLETLGVPDFQIRFSNRKVLTSLLASHGMDAQAQTDVMRLVDKAGADLRSVRRVLNEAGIAPDAVASISQLIACADIDAASQVQGVDPEGLDDMRAVLKDCQLLGMPSGRLIPDFTIARGLDYYTGSVFETFVTGHEQWGSVCSGGRYDDLAGYFSNQKYPGVGVSIGLSRLFALLTHMGLLDSTRKTPTQVLVAMQDRANLYQEYLALAGEIRSAGLACEVYLQQKSLRDQLGYASNLGIPIVLIVGGNEHANGQVLVKDMKAGGQELIVRTELLETLKARLIQP